jgi:hypothetical protein
LQRVYKEREAIILAMSSKGRVEAYTEMIARKKGIDWLSNPEWFELHGVAGVGPYNCWTLPTVCACLKAISIKASWRVLIEVVVSISHHKSS